MSIHIHGLYTHAVAGCAAAVNGIDEDWLQDPEWQRVKDMGLQRGWLIDPQEVRAPAVRGTRCVAHGCACYWAQHIL